VRGKGQAKNDDKLFWEEKFYAANGKAQAHTEYALHFFLLSLGGGGFRRRYFLVFLGSHYVDHPTIRSLWLAPKGKGGVWGGGEGPLANHELPHQDTNTNFFIIVYRCITKMTNKLSLNSLLLNQPKYNTRVLNRVLKILRM